ncbi:MAG: ATP-binding protein [Pseudomonadota bacterium]|nr:ATP-binding protein [Pseudomonadota bacterium]
MSETGHAFPIRAVVLGVAAMVLIALASAWTSWVVGQRIQTISRSQIEVLTLAERLQRHSEVLQLAASGTVLTGEPTFRRRYLAEKPKLRETLQALRQAVRLPENRKRIGQVEAAEEEIAPIEERALALAVNGQHDQARLLLESPRYLRLIDSYRAGLRAIERRSRAYVAASRDEVRRFLALNLGASVIALLLIALAWVVLVRPARSWGEQLAQAHAEARDAARAKSDFLAMMSHEIRTPLNSIIGFTDLLRNDPDLNEQQRRQVELVHNAGEMLSTVVDDVLDFSKIEAGRIELLLEPFPIEALIDNSVSIVRAAAEAKGLELRVEVDPALSPFFLGDEARLRQILLNLLNNAVKFTAEGAVTLTVRREQAVGELENLLFTVADTGIGIDADAQRRLFEPFSQADASVTRRFGGTGLGLSISRRLVELMGGEIGVESEPGQGSRFWFRAALRVAQRPAAPATAERAASARAARILLAEDLPMNRELACTILRRAGHQVDTAADGAQALAAVQRADYDLVLMDIQMPNMDGLSAARAIRALPGAKGRVPIVALTANVLPAQIREFREAGMDLHVAKPIRQADLHAAITAILSREQPQDNAQLEEGPAAFDAAAFAEVRDALPPERLAQHLERLADEVEKLAAEVNALAPGEVERAAHRIVSQAGMVGLMALSSAAASLEEAARSGMEAGPAARAFQAAAAPALERLREQPRV